MADLQAAATVVLLRESNDGAELLLLKRPQHGAFANAWVFPGGRVEVDDVLSDDDEEVDVARRTAAREAMEETGLHIEPSELHHFAVWLPPIQAPVRFHTWFFVGVVPANSLVELPETELVEHVWVSPQEAIALHQRGEIDLMPPTFVTIQGLAAATSVDDILAIAAAVEEPPVYTSHGVKTDEGMMLVWAGDSEYPDSENTQGRHRLYMGDRPWVFERIL
ncbi:MAG: NUDIX hydrolase [Candidatus Nanopelagicales bacterium]|nr:NUDIX hydrolase [Candidatus Nanopelagicales bacterium]